MEGNRRLGPYEIAASIGAGGMGEVYRATDTRLGRDVALKLLPEAFVSDPERLARFDREARLLASLNHPNIAHLYGFETATLDDGTSVHLIAMELVEGEDLAERLKRGPLPLDEAIAIAKQIAEALEEAHEKGIVHRDLKPANVKLTPDGKVKVLDFGLAKAWTGDGPGGTSSADLSQPPTLAHTGTAAGLILGTAAYMSPEQARGRAVDKKADIWAFGVVLWEMITGRRLFAGETVSDVLAAVLTREPDWATLTPRAQGRVRELLRRCLERDPKQRLHDIADARILLEPGPGRPLPGPPAAARPAPAAPAQAFPDAPAAAPSYIPRPRPVFEPPIKGETAVVAGWKRVLFGVALAAVLILGAVAGVAVVSVPRTIAVETADGKIVGSRETLEMLKTLRGLPLTGQIAQPLLAVRERQGLLITDKKILAVRSDPNGGNVMILLPEQKWTTFSAALSSAKVTAADITDAVPGKLDLAGFQRGLTMAPAGANTILLPTARSNWLLTVTGAPQPTPQPSPPDRSLTADTVLDSLVRGYVTLDAPKQMTLESSRTVTATIIPKELAALVEEALAKGRAVSGLVPISPKMIAQLTGPAFEIEPQGDIGQDIGARDPTSWTWNIQPQASGRQTLSLQIMARVPPDFEKALPALRWDVQVDVTAIQWIRINQGWVIPGAGLVGGLIGYFIGKWQGGKGRIGYATG